MTPIHNNDISKSVYDESQSQNTGQANNAVEVEIPSTVKDCHDEK